MKQTGVKLFLALLLSVPVLVHARGVHEQSPLRMVLEEAKQANIDIERYDYQLCRQVIDGIRLSSDELERVAEICDQVLDVSKHMSDEEVALCRDKLAKQLTQYQQTRAPREPLTTIESEPVDDPQSLEGSDVETFIADDGIAQTGNNTLSILGGVGIDTNGMESTITINSTAATIGDLIFDADIGDAQPSGNTITIAGGDNTITNASGSTLTVNVPSSSNLIPTCTDLEVNLVVCDGIRTENGAINNNGTSESLNIATEGATAQSSNGTSGVNIASRNTSVANTGGGSSILITLDDNSSIDLSSSQNSFTVAAGGAQISNPLSGINAYTGIDHYRIFTGSSNEKRIEAKPQGGINISTGKVKAAGNVGLNILVDGRTETPPFTSLGPAQAESLTSNAASVNIAIGLNAVATSNNESNGFNFAGGETSSFAASSGTAQSNGDSNGFNFATSGGVATSSNSNGFNFATRSSEATSSNDSNGLNISLGFQDTSASSVSSSGVNIATRGATASSSQSSGFNVALGPTRLSFGTPASASSNGGLSAGFNFAAQDADLLGESFSGFNFGSFNTTITNNGTALNEPANGSVLFALGGNPANTDPSSIDLGVNQDSFTVAVAGSQVTNPQEGVNFHINNADGDPGANNSSNLRFIDLPGAVGGENLLVIDNITGSVRISDSTVSSIASSRRFKDDITDLDDAEVHELQKLEPVSFTYKKDENNRIHFGLIAEEVAEFYPELVTKDKEGNIYGLKYHMLTPLLLKAIQIQQATIDNLEIKDMQKYEMIQKLALRIAALESDSQ